MYDGNTSVIIIAYDYDDNKVDRNDNNVMRIKIMIIIMMMRVIVLHE